MDRLMKAYWIALYKKIDSQENIKNYGEKVTEVLKSYGAKALVRGGKFKTLEGEVYPRTVIWEFPAMNRLSSAMILKNIKMVGL